MLTGKAIRVWTVKCRRVPNPSRFYRLSGTYQHRESAFALAVTPIAVHTGQHALCQLDQLPAKAEIIACRAQQGSQGEVIGDAGDCDAWEQGQKCADRIIRWPSQFGKRHIGELLVRRNNKELAPPKSHLP